MYTICFILNGRRVCIDIPLLINPWWKHLGPPPEELLGRWLKAEQVTAQVATELSVLASISELTQRLSGERAQALLAATKEGMASLQQQMPEGLEIELQR